MYLRCIIVFALCLHCIIVFCIVFEADSHYRLTGNVTVIMIRHH